MSTNKINSILFKYLEESRRSSSSRKYAKENLIGISVLGEENYPTLKKYDTGNNL